MLGLSPRCLAEDIGQPARASKTDWRPIEGRWTSCAFGGEGTIKIHGNQIRVASGQPLSGVYWNENLNCNTRHVNANLLIRDDYELQLLARRTEGFDFFCGVTFPIAEQYATLVLGGWGGAITGLSCVDGLDASQNDTTSIRQFEDNRWYRVRIRVDPAKVQCWIDEELIVQVSRRKHKFSLRTEIDLCEPLGIAAYECDAEYKDIMIRKLSETESKPSALEKAKR